MTPFKLSGPCLGFSEDMPSVFLICSMRMATGGDNYPYPLLNVHLLLATEIVNGRSWIQTLEYLISKPRLKLQILVLLSEAHMPPKNRGLESALQFFSPSSPLLQRSHHRGILRPALFEHLLLCLSRKATEIWKTWRSRAENTSGYLPAPSMRGLWWSP